MEWKRRPVEDETTPKTLPFDRLPRDCDHRSWEVCGTEWECVVSRGYFSGKWEQLGIPLPVVAAVGFEEVQSAGDIICTGSQGLWHCEWGGKGAEGES